MKTKVQLNEMELNQVAGGGIKEFFQKVIDVITHPGIKPILPKPEPAPIVPGPLPIKPDFPIL